MTFKALSLGTPVDVEETHTFCPFCLDKPLKAFAQGCTLKKRWWEPTWMFKRRRKEDARQNQQWANQMLKVSEHARAYYRDQHLTNHP